MASKSNNSWLIVLWDIVALEYFSYLLGSFIAIEEGHVAVHEDERVSVGIVLVECFLDGFYCLFAIVGESTNILTIMNA